MAPGLLSATFLSVLITQVAMIPLEDFYNFGVVHGDEKLPQNDDGSSEEIELSVSFPFFDKDYRSLFVNNNGHITFTGPFEQFSPQSFPLAVNESELQIIAPYWADVDTSGSDTDREPGSVWYRETANAELLQKAQQSISSAFVNYENFVPTYLFIATWDHVGYYDSHTDKTNTFQCVMATNGVTSFVIFLYADDGIQWTTGDATDGMNGLGGIPAQVGFNAGDGIRYASVPGSQTPEIINISTTSNVAVPGVWIFQVDQEEINNGGCNKEDVKLTLSPRYGPFLGGQTVKVQGPCFQSSSDIECIFGDQEVKAVYISKLLVICISPMLNPPGVVDFALLVDRRVYFGPTFTTLSHVRGHNVDIITESLMLTEQSTASIEWNPDTIYPLLPAIEYVVDISLYHLNVETEQWVKTVVLKTATENDGEEEITFRSIALRDADTAPVVVYVSLSPSNEQDELRGHELKPGVWSAKFYFVESSVLQPSRLCSAWYQSEPEGIGKEILDSVASCPPTEVQASQLCNSGVRLDNYISIYGNNLYTQQHMNFFHPDATCYSQPIINEIETGGKGLHCCYGKNGNLITGPPSGGTVDLWSEEIDPAKHYHSDVQPFILCCKGNLPNCALYYERRPSDDGSKFNPQPCGWMVGDPHFVTLDGFRYTFNGHGEFILVQATDGSEFVIQGRMVPPVGNSSEPVKATVFSAIVAKEMNTDTVHFQLSRRGLDVLVNGSRIEFNDLKQQMFVNVMLQDHGNATLSAIFSSGVSLSVQEANGLITLIQIVLPDRYKGAVEGLLGNFNGDPSDDLRPRSVNRPLSMYSTSEELHYNFGITWIIDSEIDSLFTYNSVNMWSEIYSPNFQPTFLMEDTDSFIADEICGDDSFCQYDIIVTGRTDIAITTLQGSKKVDLVANLSLPVICNSPCEHGVCVANDTCSCSAGYTGVTCNEIVYSECQKNPCLNGGTCMNHAGSYTCVCPPSITGSTCEDNSQRDTIIRMIAIGVVSFLIFIGSICLLTLVCCVGVKKRQNLKQRKEKNEMYMSDVTST